MNSLQSITPVGIVAHRGYAAAYPENTLPAIKAAVDAGVVAVEVDIQFSRDGVPLLLHDADIGCIASTNNKVFETNIADIKKIAICEREKCAGRSTDVFYCTLDEFADYLRQTPKLQVFVEIKQKGIDLFGAAYVIMQLEQSLKNVREQCIIISYSADFLKNVHLQTVFPIGYILTFWDDKNLKEAYSLQPEFVICNHTKIPENTNFREFAWQWLLFEITDCDQMYFYADRGVQWVESMDPVKLLECLRKNNSDEYDI
ncbi:MAG: hypothetical protein BMS9Abin25_0155 [Gammaproteobacteria bacterium]|nr:MAG: hypothetical protein BMS9Abin25_0155 [Gammaproteobacteria bacterium]